MNAGEMNILIAAEDAKLTATLAKALVVELGADITIVDTLEEAMILTASNAYDAIVASARLSDGSGLSLLSDEDIPTRAPVILLEDAPSTERVLDAIRFGAADVFPRPVETTRFIEAVRRVSRRHRRHRLTATRSKRLRGLTSRMVKDRRELRQRVDLICRDLVQAYQRLAEKVVEIQETATPEA